MTHCDSLALHAHADRAKEHAEMLEAALARPGVHELMEVYGNWLEKDQGLNVHRSATTNANPSAATTSSNS